MPTAIMLAATPIPEAVADILIGWVAADDVELAEGLAISGPFSRFEYHHMFVLF